MDAAPLSWRTLDVMSLTPDKANHSNGIPSHNNTTSGAGPFPLARLSAECCHRANVHLILKCAVHSVRPDLKVLTIRVNTM